jgi:hypothetical protein
MSQKFVKSKSSRWLPGAHFDEKMVNLSPDFRINVFEENYNVLVLGRFLDLRNII